MTDSGLKAVYLRERPKLLRLMTARLGSQDEAEDILQELWIKLQTAALGPIGSPLAYLMRTANNLAIDRRRTEIWRTARETHWVDAQPTAAEHPDAAEAMIARERLAEVNAAIDALPERVGRVFRLYRLEGLAQKEIAREMGISLSLVEKLLQQAYRAIHDRGGRKNAAIANGPRLSSKEDSA